MVDFGAVPVGTRGQQRLVLRNPTSRRATLTLGPFPTGSAFSLVKAQTTFELEPGQQTAVDLLFSPASEGVFRDQLPLRTSALCAPTQVRLEGLGVAEGLTVRPAALDFGFVALDGAKTLELRFENFFATEARLSRFTIDGPRSSAFSVTAPDGRVLSTVTVPGATRDASFGLSPGAQTVQVRFAPRLPGRFEGTLTVTTNTPRTPTLSTALSGFGGGPKVSVPDRLEVGRVAVFAGAPSVVTRTLRLANVGNNTVPPELEGNLRFAAPPGG